MDKKEFIKNLISINEDANASIVNLEADAQAIKIENGAVTPTYIQYLWVRQQNLSGENTKVIYIPTETGLPLLEANRDK